LARAPTGPLRPCWGLRNEATHLIIGAKRTDDGVELALELDPRTGGGSVSAVHEDGVSSGAKLLSGAYLHYKGKTLSNEANSATYEINGVRNSLAYIDARSHPNVNRSRLATEFVDRDGDGLTRFLIYDYGPGDKVTVPGIVSVDNGGAAC